MFTAKTPCLNGAIPHNCIARRWCIAICSQRRFRASKAQSVTGTSRFLASHFRESQIRLSRSVCSHFSANCRRWAIASAAATCEANGTVWSCDYRHAVVAQGIQWSVLWSVVSVVFENARKWATRKKPDWAERKSRLWRRLSSVNRRSKTAVTCHTNDSFCDKTKQIGIKQTLIRLR